MEKLVESLNSILNGRTITKVGWKHDMKELWFYLSDDSVLTLSASAEFDHCNDFQGVRLYINVEDNNGKFEIDNYIS